VIKTSKKKRGTVRGTKKKERKTERQELEEIM
jgi:hypothetical protein